MDSVNKPPHYIGKVEAIDAIESAMTHEAFKGYLHGNCIKYLMRFTRKNGQEDLLKAEWYLKKLIENNGKNRQI
jgi:hypothetical protein